MSKSKSGWLLYIMVHFPMIVFFKVGITSLSIGAKARAKGIDREMPGFPLPIFVLPIPGAYYVEQELHKMMSRFKVDFYRGSGHSEWFFLAPLFIALPIMLVIWYIYLCGIDRALGTTIAPVLSGWFFELLTNFFK